jgi:hypothetical protein
LEPRGAEHALLLQVGADFSQSFVADGVLDGAKGSFGVAALHEVRRDTGKSGAWLMVAWHEIAGPLHAA